MKTEHIWSAALGELQLQMTQATFDTWLRDSKLLRREQNTLVIGVKSGYAKDWLETRLSPTIKRTLGRLMGQPVELSFVVWSDQVGQRQDASLFPANNVPDTDGVLAAPAQRPSTATTPLNRHYTFDSFVVGPGNRLAQAASLAVAENPAGAYNPLFIYGGVGLGKTHLLHAIGHACQSRGLRVVYTSSEEFTNDLIEAIRSHITEAFRDKYRTAQVLLVDDIQFIAGKERTQEEFFHTFNTLHRTGRQIAISSDRPPKAMSTLEERLCSRFEWGLIADVQPPELETRIAILREKAARCPVTVPHDVLELIASRVQSNIRELEGTLNKVVALSSLTLQPMTTDLVETALSTLAPRHAQLDPAEIVRATASHFGTTVSQLEGPGRARAVARPRQIAMYLMRQETGLSLPEIGALLGGRDHTTIMYGCGRIASLIEQDTDTRRQIVALRQRLHSRAL